MKDSWFRAVGISGEGAQSWPTAGPELSKLIRDDPQP